MKYTIDNLTEKGVSIKTEKIIVSDGIEYAVSQPHRIAVANTAKGRASLDEYPAHIKDCILAFWGDELYPFEAENV